MRITQFSSDPEPDTGSWWKIFKDEDGTDDWTLYDIDNGDQMTLPVTGLSAVAELLLAAAAAREILTETISNHDEFNLGRVREICGDVPTEYVLYAMTIYATTTWNRLSDLSGRDPAEARQSVMLRVVRSEMEDGEDAS